MMEHPLGGPDWKLMAEQLEAVMDLASDLALRVNSLESQIATMGVVQPSPTGWLQPKNWRSQ